MVGIVVIVMGVNGRSTVTTSLKQQQIVGTADMTPAGITAEVQKAGLKNVTIPSCSVANQAVTTGASARCFAQYMQIHALEATGGFVYAQMGQYTAKPGTPAKELAPGGGTSNTDFAVIDSTTKQPVSNGARNVWVTETALSTALDSSYMASQLALFGIVVGVALLLSGLGQRRSISERRHAGTRRGRAAAGIDCCAGRWSTARARSIRNAYRRWAGRGTGVLVIRVVLR